MLPSANKAAHSGFKNPEETSTEAQNSGISAVADLGGAPPYSPKFSRFHAVFRKF